MMNLGSTQLTSADLWQSAFFITVIDGIFISLLFWRINRERFWQLRWPLVTAAAVFWGGFAFVFYRVFWDAYYRYFSSSWLYNGGSLVLGILLGIVLALLFHWAACRLPGNPLVGFYLVCGLESLLEHLWGIHSLRILDIPMLQGVSPISILAFAFPEYIFYWCIVISMAVLIQNGWKWWLGLMLERTRSR